MATTTRSRTEVYLLGTSIDALTGSKLPSIGDVLRLYVHKLKSTKTKHEAAVAVIMEVQLFWQKARIPMRRIDHAICQLEELVQKWEGLKKNKARRTATQVLNEETLSVTFNDLFDVAHQDALEMIRIEEDKQFLLAQREKGRRGVMAGVDVSLTKKEETKAMKRKRQIELKNRHEIEMANLQQSVVLESSCSSSGTDDENTDTESEVAGATGGMISSKDTSKRQYGKTNILTPAVLSSLDRTKTSDRNAVQIIAPVIQAAGQDINEYTISRSSIRRSRQMNRTNMSSQLKMGFNPQKPMVLHWDGKLMNDLTGDEKIDRLPIIVSGSGIEQLLCVPKLPSGTGKAMAEAMIATLADWGITDSIKALSFDTTASNTGRINGACVLVEQQLGRNVLHLACRHHIHEIMLEEVFSITMGPSSGPDIQLFKRFKAFWPHVVFTDYKPGIDVPVIARALADVLDETKAFITDQLDMSHQREDYRELLELALVFTGGVPSRGLQFRKPGAIHRARFMARLIYALKIYIFRDSGFKLTDREVRGLGDFCAFGVASYIKSWFLCRLPTAAPASDLQLMKRLVSSGSPASLAALKKLSGQLWYLSEELVALAFFDQQVDVTEKQSMVEALAHQGTEDPPKRITLDHSKISNMQLHDFVTHNTMNFFHILSIPSSFLAADPNSWASNEAYLEAEAVVRELRVVNDTAERGVALMHDYNELLTKNEEQMQFALQVVKEHRNRFPDSKKSTVLQGLTLTTSCTAHAAAAANDER
jgi:hypothetical protein